MWRQPLLRFAHSATTRTPHSRLLAPSFFGAPTALSPLLSPTLSQAALRPACCPAMFSRTFFTGFNFDLTPAPAQATHDVDSELEVTIAAPAVCQPALRVSISVSPYGDMLDEDELDEAAAETETPADSGRRVNGAMYASSTLKKRRLKMNKHKYRKRRKRDRQRSK